MYSVALIAMEIAETVWDLASAAIQEHYRDVTSVFLCVSCTLEMTFPLSSKGNKYSFEPKSLTNSQGVFQANR